MNSTRTKWSKLLGCHLPEPKAEVPFIISVILISLTPVVFYATAKHFAATPESRLLRHEWHCFIKFAIQILHGVLFTVERLHKTIPSIMWSKTSSLQIRFTIVQWHHFRASHIWLNCSGERGGCDCQDGARRSKLPMKWKICSWKTLEIKLIQIMAYAGNALSCYAHNPARFLKRLNSYIEFLGK